MPTIFNDREQPSTKPCAGGWLRECDREDYASWYRMARDLDAQLSVVEEEGSVAQQAEATAQRLIFATFPKPGFFATSGGVPLKPSRAKSVAAWSQQMADVMSREDSVVTLSPKIFEVPQKRSDIPPFLQGIGAGVVVGGLLVGAGLWYAKTREWI